MRLRFIYIGRTKSPYLEAGIKDFLKRIRNYFPAEEVALKGVKARDDRAAEVRSEDTGRLLSALKPDEVFIHLDPNGREMTSEELAVWLQEQMAAGAKTLSFGLGGPLGLDEAAAKRANLRLCLSRLTLTHEMSRLILLEQIYRALRLNAGHPYHK